MKKIIYALFMSVAFLLTSQAETIEVLADFEDGTAQGIGVWAGGHTREIIVNPFQDADNPSDYVLFYTGAGAWGAINKWDGTGSIFQLQYLKFLIDVYVPEGQIAAYGNEDNSIVFQMIAGGSISGAANLNIPLNINTEQAWVTIEFDLADLSAFDYRQISIQYQGINFYADNLRFEINPITPDIYTLSTEVTPGGAGTVSGAGEYAEGSVVNLAATASPGFLFYNWTNEAGDVLGYISHLQMNMPSANTTVTANFIAIEDNPNLILWADFEDGTLQGFNEVGFGEDSFTEVVDNPLSEDKNSSAKVLRWKDVSPWGGAWKWEPGVFSPEYTKMIVDVMVPAAAAQGGTNTMFQLRGQSSETDAPEWHSPWKQLTVRDQWVTLEFDLTVLPVHDFQMLFLISSFDEYYADNFIFIKEDQSEPETYTLTLLASPEEGGTVIGEGEYAAGESIFVQLIVNPGFQFVNWTNQDGQNVSNFLNFSFTMPAANTTLTANFNVVYALELEVSPDGAGTVSGAGNYAEGASVSVSAQANAGFNFVNWTDAGGDEVSNQAAFTYTMPAIATTLTANFEEAEAVVINEFPWVEDFEEAVFPPEGWVIANELGAETWIRKNAPGGGFSAYHVYGDFMEDTWLISPAIEIPDNGDFELNFHHYNIYADYYPGAGGNNVMISTGSFNPADDDFVQVWSPATVLESTWEDVTLSLAAYAGETIFIAFRYNAENTHEWYVDDITVSGAAAELFTLTLAVDPENAGTVTGAGEYAAGSSVALSASANAGYSFFRWTNENDEVVSYLSQYIYTMPEGDATLTANFVSLANNHDLVVFADFEDGTHQGFTATTSDVEDNPGSDAVNSSSKALFYHVGQQWDGPNKWVAEGDHYSPEYLKMTVDVYLNEGSLFQWEWYPDAPIVVFELRGQGSISGAPNFQSPGNLVFVEEQWVRLEFDLTGMTSYDYRNFRLISSATQGWYSDNYIFYKEPSEAPELFTLTTQANPAEAALTLGDGEYAAGESIFVQLIVNPGFQFVNWTNQDGQNVSNFLNFSYTMPAENTTLTANFNVVYALELEVSPDGSGTVSGAGNYAEGASVSVSAQANAGFNFVNWTDADGDEVSNQAAFTYTMPAIATTLTANFEEAEAVVINEFPWVEDFEEAVFPPEGWVIANELGAETWIRKNAPGGGFSAYHVYGDFMEDTWLISPAIEIPDNGDFELNFHHYNIYADYYPGAGGNNVMISTGSFNPADDDFVQVWSPATVLESTWEDVTLSLAAYAGETIFIAFRYNAENTHEWYVDDVTVSGDLPELFTLTTLASPAEGANAIGTGEYEVDEIINVRINSTPGFQFNNWTNQDGEVVSEVPSFNFTMPAEDVTLTANLIQVVTDPNIIMIADFEDSTPQGVTAWEGHSREIISNPHVGDANSSNYVLQYIGSAAWGGINRWTNPGPFSSAYDYFAIDVFIPVGEIAQHGSPNNTITFQLTAGGSLSGASNVTMPPVAVSEEGQWITVLFDVSSMTVFDYRNLMIQYQGLNAYFDNLRFLIVDTYDLILAVNPENAGTVTGAGDYEEGTVVSLTAAAAEGFVFVSWTNEADAVVSNEPNFDFTMPAEAVTLTANFEEIPPVFSLTLIVNPDDAGTVTGAGDYEEGTAVSLTANAAEGFVFVSWTNEADAVVSNEPNFDFTMPAGAVTLTANFEEIPPVLYSLTLLANPVDAGTVTGAGDYEEGTAVSLSANAAEGFVFVSWTNEADAVVSNQPDFDYTMPAADVTLTANFEEIPPVLYTLSLQVSPENAGSVSGEGDYEEGAVVSLNATANDGFVFINWTDANDQIISTEAAFDYTMPAEAILLTANFDIIDNVEMVLANAITLFPNPARDHFRVVGESTINLVIISDITGKVVLKEMPVQRELIVHQNFEPGIYVVRVYTDYGIATQRLIISD